MSMKKEQMQWYHDKIMCCTWRDVHCSLVAFIGSLFVASLDVSSCFVLVLLPCPAHPHCSLTCYWAGKPLQWVQLKHELEAVDSDNRGDVNKRAIWQQASNLLRDPSSAAFMGSLPPSKTMIG